MKEGSPQAFDLTVLACTYNRCRDLREMLESVAAQETGDEFTCEVLVVDNNSSDGTRQVAEEFGARKGIHLRYLFEGRQGKSYALNTGINAARGAIYVLADDDLIFPPGYLRTIVSSFKAHPEVSFIGGKVLPLWRGEPPRWLTPKHWSAIAMADFGEEEFYTDSARPLCLLACSFRTAHVKSAGGYHINLGVTKGHVGGTEDADLLAKLYKSGRKGLYLPTAKVYHKVEPHRLTKAYHRRWHTGHGRDYAVMRAEEVERSRARLFDVPAHLFKQAARDALSWAGSTLAGRGEEAFWHETQLRFFVGFFRQRRRDFFAARRRSRK